MGPAVKGEPPFSIDHEMVIDVSVLAGGELKVTLGFEGALADDGVDGTLVQLCSNGQEPPTAKAMKSCGCPRTLAGSVMVHDWTMVPPGMLHESSGCCIELKR